MTALEVFHGCLTFILSLRRHIWVWWQWAGWNHHGWSGLLAVVGLFYCVEYTVTTLVCAFEYPCWLRRHTLCLYGKGESTDLQSSLLLVCFRTVQHYSCGMHLISRQPLGSDTSPIAYYTARGVRSVIGVVASQGTPTGLRNKVRQSHQRWHLVRFFLRKLLGILRYPKIVAIGDEIFEHKSRVK